MVTLFQNDVVGVLFVYCYVAVLLVVTEKVLSKKFPVGSRKFLHIMTGNIAFILPVFVTREIMAFVAAGPFIVFTLLMSPYSPIRSLRGKTSEAGHGFGLVFYAISWTILGYVFFDTKEVIAIAILAMSYGDGLASLLGVKYGVKKYRVVHDVKSYFGSLMMLLFTFLLMVVALVYYAVPFEGETFMLLFGIAGIVTIIEGVTPWGLDNLSVPFSVALLYWGLVVL